MIDFLLMKSFKLINILFSDLGFIRRTSDKNTDGGGKYVFTNKLDLMMEGLSGFSSLKLTGKPIEAGLRQMSLNFRSFGSNDKIDCTLACRSSVLKIGKHFLTPEGFE